MPTRRLRAPLHWRPHVLAMAAAATLLSSALAPQAANAQPLAQVAEKGLRAFSIPAAPMETALNQLAREARMMIAFDPELVRGLQSPGFQGVATLQRVLDALLDRHALLAQSAGQGAWRVRPAPGGLPNRNQGSRVSVRESRMGEVVVAAKKDPRQQVFETAGSVAVVTRGDKLQIKAAWFNNKVRDYVTLARIM